MSEYQSEFKLPIFKEGYSLKLKLGVGGFRGLVTKEGKVVGWPIVDGDHQDFHNLNGTRDGDFETRWRQWHAGEAVEIDSGNPEHHALVEVWLDLAYEQADEEEDREAQS